MMFNKVEEDDEESIRSLFKKVHRAYVSNIEEDETFRRILMTADVSKGRYPTPRPPSAMRLGTATGVRDIAVEYLYLGPIKGPLL